MNDNTTNWSTLSDNEIFTAVQNNLPQYQNAFEIGSQITHLDSNRRFVVEDITKNEASITLHWAIIPKEQPTLEAEMVEVLTKTEENTDHRAAAALTITASGVDFFGRQSF